MVKRQRSAQATPSAAAPQAASLSTSIKLSEVMGVRGLRLEASSYNVAARAAVAALRAAGHNLIPLFGEGGLSQEAHNAFRFRRVFVKPERGVAFLSSAEVISMRPRAERYISRKQTPKLSELLVRKWDVMISCSGTIGNVALAGDTFTDKALSQDAIRLRVPNAETAGFITAFLRSRFGRPQIAAATYGSVIVHIEPEHLERILVPEITPIRRIAIGTLMREATELRDHANNLLDEADRLLHARLNLPPLKGESSKAPLVGKVKASNLNGRLDASYHNPRIPKLMRKLKASGVPLSILGDLEVCKEVRAVTKFRKRVYVPHGGIPLMGGKQLFQVDPVDVKGLAKGAHEKDLKEIGLDENMVTVTCSGTIGRIQIIPRYMSEWTANQHAHRLVAANGMNPGYLYAWLASDYGQLLVTRQSYGSVIFEVDREMLGSVAIPIPEAAVRDEIGRLVLEANRLRNEAWQKEQDAIQQVNALAD
jgi:type I restriction enzyme S subunit